VIRLAIALLLMLGTPAIGACRQALVLGLDISGSVDDGEYRQQLDGLAGALAAPAVRAALLAMPGAAVDLAVFEWSGPQDQRLILTWRTLGNDAAITQAAGALAATRRRPGDPSTALGSALAFGSAALTQRSACWRHVLDISGDGTSNAGPRPQDVRDALPPPDMTINALVIGSETLVRGERRAVDANELSAYFRANVIRGDSAFVETALGFADYRTAMERKLLRELQVIAIGKAP